MIIALAIVGLVLTLFVAFIVICASSFGGVGSAFRGDHLPAHKLGQLTTDEQEKQAAREQAWRILTWHNRPKAGPSWDR